jgi:hypothetical protein
MSAAGDVKMNSFKSIDKNRLVVIEAIVGKFPFCKGIFLKIFAEFSAFFLDATAVQ